MQGDTMPPLVVAKEVVALNEELAVAAATVVLGPAANAENEADAVVLNAALVARLTASVVVRDKAPVAAVAAVVVSANVVVSAELA